MTTGRDPRTSSCGDSHAQPAAATDALTDHVFWDDYWDDIHLPDTIDPSVRWQAALTTAFLRHLPRDSSRSIFEIGCAPGRWLIWFNKALGYQVAGCDTSPKGVELTRENFRLNDVDGEVFAADVLTDDLPQHAYDIVYSIGVIEHFRDPMRIIGRHLQLLKPNGLLILEVPNMAGAVNLKLMRMAGLHKFLAVHNLDMMNRAFFRSVADRFDIHSESLDYIGGFDPGMIWNHFLPALGDLRIREKIRRDRTYIIPFIWLMVKVFRRFPGLLINANHPAFSHLLMASYRVPAK